MFFNNPEPEPLYVSRSDESNPLGSFSRHGFALDDADWPTVEHYFQGMKFTDPGQRAAIRNMASPTEAQQLAEKHVRAVRKDWKKIQQTVMTRGLYIKCLTHPEVAKALLMTDTREIVESADLPQSLIFFISSKQLKDEVFSPFSSTSSIFRYPLIARWIMEAVRLLF